MRVRQAGLNTLNGGDYGLELGALSPEGLRSLRIVPDRGLFELAIDFYQTFAAFREVKDTPSRHQGALACL